MAKFKAARGKDARKAPSRGAIPCVILILAGIVLLGMLFYSILKSS
jgi:hypothetical protein